MNIFYLITLVILLSFLFLFKKSDKILNGLIWIVYTIAIYLCFNMFIVFVLSFMRIPSTLFVLGIINLIISWIIFYYRICNKKIRGKKVVQKYYFNLKEVIGFCLIIGVVLVISYFRFNSLSTINYETTDPAVHYKIAKIYAETESLLTASNSVDELYGDFARALTGSYINGGTFIRVLSFIESYKAFIIYDIFMYLISALLFFVTCLDKIKSNKKNILIIFILSFLYMLGYPLNNLLFGFSYLGIGVFMINLIFITINMLRNKELVKIRNYLLFTLFLFNYGLFFSYYLFVPFIYLAEGLYLLYYFFRKKISFKETLKYGISVLIIPFLLGFCYFVLSGYLTRNEVHEVTALAMEGYIYRDLLSNFIIILPLFLFSIMTQLKEKEKSYNLFVVVIFGLFTLGMLILGIYGKASSYYFFKLYFPMWLVFYLNIVEVLNFEGNECRNVLVSNLVFILVILFIAGTKIEFRIQEKNILFSPSTVTRNITDLYVFNGNRVVEERPIFSKEELSLVRASENYFAECVNDNLEFPMVANYLHKLWYYSMYDVVPVYNHIKGNLSQFYEPGFDYDRWLVDGGSQCLMIFNSSNDSEDNDNYINIDYEDFDILFKNSAGYVIKKKN